MEFTVTLPDFIGAVSAFRKEVEGKTDLGAAMDMKRVEGGWGGGPRRFHGTVC